VREWESGRVGRAVCAELVVEAEATRGAVIDVIFGKS
jgi:hypothetical protein